MPRATPCASRGSLACAMTRVPMRWIASPPWRRSRRDSPPPPGWPWTLPPREPPPPGPPLAIARQVGAGAPVGPAGVVDGHVGVAKQPQHEGRLGGGDAAPVIGHDAPPALDARVGEEPSAGLGVAEGLLAWRRKQRRGYVHGPRDVSQAHGVAALAAVLGGGSDVDQVHVPRPEEGAHIAGGQDPPRF